MTRWTIGEMTALARRGMGKIDLYGTRGATLVTMDEIEAMAGALACFGLSPIAPGTYPTPNQPSEGQQA